MYYKITNKESKVFKRVHEMRSKEIQYEKDNINAIEQKTGLTWNKFLGHKGQQNFNRVTDYCGFIFKEIDKVDSKIWKIDSESGAYVPNKRTKLGREMNEFLLNGLKGNSFFKMINALGLNHPRGSFIFPFVEICGDLIIIYLDDKYELTGEEFVEITKREFNQILDEENKKNA